MIKATDDHLDVQVEGQRRNGALGAITLAALSGYGVWAPVNPEWADRRILG